MPGSPDTCCTFSQLKEQFGGGSPCISLSDYYKGGTYISADIADNSPGIPSIGSPVECISLSSLCGIEGCGDWSTFVSLGPNSSSWDHLSRSWDIDGSNVYIYTKIQLDAEPDNALFTLDTSCGFLKEVKTIDFATSPGAGLFTSYTPINGPSQGVPQPTSVVIDSVDSTKLKVLTTWYYSGDYKLQLSSIDISTLTIDNQVEVPIPSNTVGNLATLSNGDYVINSYYWEVDEGYPFNPYNYGLYINSGSPEFFNFYSLYNDFYDEQKTIRHDNVGINYIQGIAEYNQDLVLLGFTEWRPTDTQSPDEGLWYDQDWIALVILDKTDYTNTKKKFNFSRNSTSDCYTVGGKVFGDYAYVVIAWVDSTDSNPRPFYTGILKVRLNTSPMQLEWFAGTSDEICVNPYGRVDIVQHPTNSDIIYLYGPNTEDNNLFLVKIDATDGSILNEWTVGATVGTVDNFNMRSGFGKLFFGISVRDTVSSPERTGQLTMKIDPTRIDSIGSPGEVLHMWDISQATAVTSLWSVISDTEEESTGYYFSGISPILYGSPPPSPLPDNMYLVWDTYKVLTNYSGFYESLQLLENQIIEVFSKNDYAGYSPEVYYGGSPGGTILEMRDRVDLGTFSETEEPL